jgi:hypothetical protein
LTPHAVAVDQALAAVVNETIDKLGSTDSSRPSIAPSRRPHVDPSIKYVDYLEARKAAVLETCEGRDVKTGAAHWN